MAYPSDLVRTKNWGTETLTDTDLEGQFDLIIAWVMAALDSTTGHSHDGTANEGPKIVLTGAAGISGVLPEANMETDITQQTTFADTILTTTDINGGTMDGVTIGGSATCPVTDLTMSLGSDADGDVYYRSSNKLTRLAKGTAGQSLVMNSGATAPEWGTAGVTLTDSEEATTTSSSKYFLPSSGKTYLLYINCTANATTSDQQLYLKFENSATGHYYIYRSVKISDGSDVTAETNGSNTTMLPLTDSGTNGINNSGKESFVVRITTNSDASKKTVRAESGYNSQSGSEMVSWLTGFYNGAQTNGFKVVSDKSLDNLNCYLYEYPTA